MHTVRLLRMAEEILLEGEIIVKRPDAKEFLEIRNGAWDYEKAISWAEEKENYILKDLYPKSKLPKVPNLDLASKILMDIQNINWK